MNPYRKAPPTLSQQRGFSLIEMAVVLMILGLLLGGLLSAVSQTTENTRRADTNAKLKQIEEALYGFAQANGRLPCPATNASAGAEAAPLGVGNCTVTRGFLPAATLGIAGAINNDGLLTDSWGNPYRYAIASSQLLAAPIRDFASVNGLRHVYNNQAAVAANWLRVCSATPCLPGPPPVNITAPNVPAIVLSMGSNWASFSSAEETENVGTTMGAYPIPANNDFVSTLYNETQFDDLIIWLSPNILFSRMISAGKLP
ncbi:MAG: type II secretion system protein [Pseudohongiella sp.]|nr:type II secretion system protein [Pseudohongiella sp.]MDP2126817.1 type II secretion system protein [Pseudohongiella sp.]